MATPLITGEVLRRHLMAEDSAAPIADWNQVAAAASKLVMGLCVPIPEPYETEAPDAIEAALAVGMDIWKSREAPGGVTMGAEWAVPTSYRLSSVLMLRVGALIASWRDAGTLVG